jgi:hypothetical protein
MINLKFNINADEIAAEFKGAMLEVKQEIEAAVENLATLTHAKIKELADEKLHSTHKTYMDSLEGPEEISPGVFVITLHQDALFIEEGLKNNFDMKPGLLDGKKYRIIPFEHTKGPSQSTPKAQMIVDKLKSELKRAKIPYKKIEKTADGSPRVGLLHKINLPSQKPSPVASHEALHGVRIYQTLNKNGKARRSIFTFRTVSAGPASDGKWIHPGLEKKQFFEKALEWAEKEFETVILPEILNKWEDFK